MIPNIPVILFLMIITVYSTTTCPYCMQLKKYLDERSISYTEKVIDQDDAAREEMLADSGGFMGVPFTVITKDDGTKETIIGFDKGKLNQVIGL
ncbi:MAG: Glutaredoxin [Candidatus Woesebacteria bacterium GW2011_GWB1_38_5]|uniref:Glutaredoxin n=2 Tax=Candidatus Woeseibacteriota TaxID=1752722 RepID=A0A0G0N6D0_9BACT|nr:MAG: Glutaredoxin [Candidatus Woesebacteria bacterium GW2011_GWB1_38_5]